MKKIKVIVILFLSIFSPLSVFSQSKNGTCPCTIPIDTSFHIVPMTMGPDVGAPPYYQNDNAASPGIALPFNFCFYGQNIDSVYISNNGIISFNYPIYNCKKTGGFPLGQDSLIIAPFYADANTRSDTGGRVYYKITSGYMIVAWD